jgi:uncharacterized protein
VKPLAAVLVFAANLAALDLKSLKPEGYVSDFARVIDAASKARIEEYCTRLEQTTGAQFAVVTIQSLDGLPIEDAAVTLFNQWGIGKKESKEGLLILLAMSDRKQRAEIGYGLEPIITDGFAGSVLRSLRPLLRQGQIGTAMIAAVEQFGSRVESAKGVSPQTPQPAEQPQAEQPYRERSRDIPWPLLLGGGFFFLLFLSRLFGGRRGGRGGWGGGGPGGLAQTILLGNLLGQSGRSWGHGGFGGYDSGGGGGGFGGFGGGSSGGGGASSDW